MTTEEIKEDTYQIGKEEKCEGSNKRTKENKDNNHERVKRERRIDTVGGN